MSTPRGTDGDRSDDADDELPARDFEVDGADGGDSGSDVRHQPASPLSMRRQPPASSVCAGVRGLLRDYADFELQGADRERVDEHVHLCRDCGVALSRIEAEVYRLRRAMSPAAGPGPEFVRQVMARVRAAADADRQGDATAAELAGDAAVPADFTPRVMERIRREWKQPSPAQRALATVRRFAVPVLLAAAIVLLGSMLVFGGGRDGRSWSVLSARGARLHRSDPPVVLQAGMQLVPRDRLAVTGRDSAATVVLRGGGEQDDAVLEVESETELAVLAMPAERRGAFVRLDHGGLSIRVLDPHGVGFALSDGTRIELESGLFRVFAEPVVRHDARLATEAVVVGVRLAATQGRACIVRRAHRTVVDAGKAALFDSGSSIQFEPLYTDAELSGLLATPSDLAQIDRVPADASRPRDCVGRVIYDRTGAGVGGVAVMIRTASGVREAVSAADGSFRLEEADALVGQLVVVRATLPESADSSVLAGIANFDGAMRLRSEGFGPQREVRLAPIRLPADRSVAGTVLSADGTPVAGARVTPYLLDRVLERATPLESVVAVTTERDGRFALRRLAVEQPAHTDVVLLVEHAQHGALAAFHLVHAPSLRDRSLEIVVPPRERVTVASLPPHEPVQVFSSIRNLPPAVMLSSTTVVASASGAAELDVGQGATLWVQRDGRLAALVASSERSGAFLASDAAVEPAVASMVASARLGDSTPLHRRGGRFEVLASANVGVRRTISLQDGQGQAVSGAQLFLVAANGDAITYLGEASAGSGDWHLPNDFDGRIVAIGDDGAVAVVPVAGQVDELRLRLLPPGVALLPDEVIGEFAQRIDPRSGFFVIEMRMVDGPLQGMVVHRPVGRDGGWAVQGLLPGNYHVRLPDGRQGRVTITPGGRARIDVTGEDGSTNSGR